MEGSIAPCGHLESPGLQCWWVKVSSSREGPCYGGTVEQKWRQAAFKAGQKAVLGEPVHPPGSGMATESVNNHHHSHSGHF